MNKLYSPRIMAGYFVTVGLGIILWLIGHHEKGIVTEDLLIAAPAPLIVGIASMIEPRLMLAATNRGRPQPAKFKVAGYCLLGIGFIIGIYISHVLFRK